MTKHDPKELKAVVEHIEEVIQFNRDLLNQEPRILRPLQEARDAAKVRYRDAGEGK